ncbi:MAG: DNA-directed RNA polymerase subunit alpha [Vampirovibrionales bacterium]|nr:DNA-directed RNA polymerase subunit alpha [Vampirovibrionales bacterium]
MEHQLNIKCVNTTTDSDGSIYGKFVIEPLERGYGTTLGNSLRRVLLSSLSGAAITSVRVEGVTHEFTAIPGVVEDVLDVMLNLKGVVLKSDSPEPQYLRIDVDRPGPVVAGDIEAPADVRIVNPDWHICTVADGGGFHADLTSETGNGYVPAEQNLAGKNKAVDTLMLDAAFMPVRRVAYNVEETRVGQRTDYDKLVLEIWSNGSLDVSTGLSQAANILIEHLLPVASLSGIPTTLAPQTREDDKPRGDSESSTSITIEDLELSVRAFNCLKRANINSIAELLQKSEADLLAIKNFGKKSSDEVIERLRAFGLDLKPSPVDVEMESYH